MEQQFTHFDITEFDTQQSEAFYTMVDSNRARLEDYFAGTVKHTQTLADTKQYCLDMATRIQQKNYFVFIIICKKTGQYIGLIDVKNIVWSVPKAEIGYFIDTVYEGKGIISNALPCVLQHLQQAHQFKKLLCRANSKNVASIGVALSNGFELEGTIRNDYKTTDNEIVDLNYYGKIYP